MENVISSTQEKELQYLKEIFSDVIDLNQVINEEINEMNNDSSINLNDSLEKKLSDVSEKNNMFTIQNRIVNMESKKKELSLSAKNLMVQKHIISSYIK